MMRHKNEYDEAGRIVGRMTECDLSANEWQWIELVIGALGALSAIVFVGLW